MMFKNSIITAKVKIIKSINVNDVAWCDEAVLFVVKNGKGTLTHRISDEDEKYEYVSQLMLNNKPILQGKYPVCPTCAGMLATGYGIENINSMELKKVRECINSEFSGIESAFDNIKPLLGLLDDGYYVLADTRLYPSNGQGEFFYSIPNELTRNEVTCCEYYDSDFLCTTEGYPAYIYPTQSSEIIQEERVEEYIKIIKNSNNPPRGLAYYEQGFMCALLDGHHKACAASSLGEMLNCYTIIPPDQFYFGDEGYKNENTTVKKVGFAGIMLETEKGTKLKDYQTAKGYKEKKINVDVYNLTSKKLPDKYFNTYPTIRTLSGMINAEVDTEGDVVCHAREWLSIRNEDNVKKLEYLMSYLSQTRREETMIIAKMILDEEDTYLLGKSQNSAIKVMLKHKNNETEQYMINYMVNHDSNDSNWELVNSYWD